MKIDGKEFIRELKIDDKISAYDLSVCAEYISGGVLWKESERNSKHIGYLTCLNHPSRDGTNPHWRIIIDINEQDSEKLTFISLKRFAEALKKATSVIFPIWIELRECSSKTHEVIGDLWNEN